MRGRKAAVVLLVAVLLGTVSWGVIHRQERPRPATALLEVDLREHEVHRVHADRPREAASRSCGGCGKKTEPVWSWSGVP